MNAAIAALNQAGSGFFSAWSVIVPFSIFISLVLFAGIAYAKIRLMQIGREEKKKYGAPPPALEGARTPSQFELRWRSIVAHANSENENDWRHAIMDADIILDELLDVQGYHGDTMGDKLKQVERSDFNTIDAAWEAHKYRNKVAHEGSALQMSAREVSHVIGLYEQVFREFELI